MLLWEKHREIVNVLTDKSKRKNTVALFCSPYAVSGKLFLLFCPEFSGRAEKRSGSPCYWKKNFNSSHT